jgi:hypothetical protein
MASKPIMVMGKGCGRKDLEHCPQIEHFELTEEELAFALKNPAHVAQRLGLDTPEAIHVRGPEVKASRPEAPATDADTIRGTDRERGVDEPAADSPDAGTGDAGTGPSVIYCCVRCLTNSWCCTAWPAGSVTTGMTDVRVLDE